MIFRFKLILCALGFHEWFYYCRDRYAPRDSRRECARCCRVEDKELLGGQWGEVR